MSRMIVINIDDQEENAYHVEARSNDNALISVSADSYDQAQDIIKQALKEADIAVKAWKPNEVKPIEPTKEAEPKHDTRIIKEFENAEKFCDKHNFGGFRLRYYDELFKLHPWDALRYCQCLGYRAGFNKAKKLCKEGRCKA